MPFTNLLLVIWNVTAGIFEITRINQYKVFFAQQQASASLVWYVVCPVGRIKMFISRIIVLLQHDKKLNDLKCQYVRPIFPRKIEYILLL